VIGGMLAASVIAIFLIPVTFDVVERWTARVKGTAAGPSKAQEPGADAGVA
jgi:hypothetical protein